MDLRVYGRFPKLCLSLGLTLILSACTEAGTNVRSLLPSLNLFTLDQDVLRISSLSQLSSITFSARCTSQNQGFEFDVSNTTPEVWDLMPAALPSGRYLGATNQCATGGTISFTLNLSSDFATMTPGSLRILRVRERDSLGLNSVRTLTIIYSNVTLQSPQRLLGQGGVSTVTSGRFALQGQVIEISDLTKTTSGAFTLEGRVMFQ